MKRNAFLIFIAIFIFFVAIWRWLSIYNLFDEPSGCGECLVLGAALADAPFLAVCSALLWIGFRTRITFFSWLSRVSAVVLTLIYFADVYVLNTFFTRLYITWVINIGATPGVVMDHLKSRGLLELFGLLVIIGVLVAVAVYKPKVKKGHAKRFALIGAILFFSIITNQFHQVEYVHAWATENVLFMNQFQGISEPYSGEYLASIDFGADDLPFCRPGLNAQDDVVVLILESWSAYQSKIWGGELDWTPSLDEIAKNSTLSTRFIAGGFNTNQGLMAIISGIPVLSSLTSLFTRKSFEPAWGLNFTLPSQLSKGGYHTAFLTSGNLDFHGKAGWIDHLGFDYVEDHSHSVYEGHPRTHFNAAPDEVLFKRSIDYWTEKKNLPEPIAIVIESVSSHTPFIHPITGEKGEETAIQYMDAAVGEFYSRLVEEGFFSSGGVLVTVSDHRSMTVLRDDERRLFGIWAPALVPMFVHGESISPTVSNKVLHQSDIAPSLAMRMTSQGCGFPGWQSIFDLEVNRNKRCVFHAAGNDWDKLMVYCDSGFGVVQLDGDNSRFVDEENLSSQEKIEILENVAILRESAQRITDSYLDQAQ